MRWDALKDEARLRIVERSAEILREHGERGEELYLILLDKFHIDEETLRAIVRAYP